MGDVSLRVFVWFKIHCNVHHQYYSSIYIMFTCTLYHVMIIRILTQHCVPFYIRHDAIQYDVVLLFVLIYSYVKMLRISHMFKKKYLRKLINQIHV